MKIELPEGLEPFAREFSKGKTPAVRTQGWYEQSHESRGEGDVLDTIGSLMLWRYLTQQNVSTTYLLTGRQGDEGDLLIQAGPRTMSINVKTSKFQPNNDDPCRWNHIAVKEVELARKLPDLYVAVFVHLTERDGPSHVHLCNWIATDSDAFRSQTVQAIPNSNNCMGYWISQADLMPITDLVPWTAGCVSSAW